MEIQKAEKTKLNDQVENSVFGKAFTDHMLICTYKDGSWHEPKIIPFGSVSFPPAMMAIHYGQACFEGMKAYKNDQDDVFLFRPESNFERINKSAVRLAMPEIPENVFMNGIQTLIDLERDWVPKELGKSLYIRPVLFASEEMFLARVSNEYTFCVMCAVANNYYSKPLKVKIAQRFSRAAEGGVGFAKAAGNYAASFYPTQLAREEGYDQLIWTDSIEHEYLEESGTMNIFVRINDSLITPPISEKILNGVTRDSIIQLAKNMGWEVEERKITVTEVLEAHKNGSMKEIFGCGTAVILNRFEEIKYPNEVLKVELLEDDKSFAMQLKTRLLAIQSGRAEDPFKWRMEVKKNTIEA